MIANVSVTEILAWRYWRCGISGDCTQSCTCFMGSATKPGDVTGAASESEGGRGGGGWCGVG